VEKTFVNDNGVRSMGMEVILDCLLLFNPYVERERESPSTGREGDEG